MPRLTLIYERGCPNCGGVIDEVRLVKGLPCRDCLPLPEEVEDYLAKLPLEERLLAVARLLSEAGMDGRWVETARLEEEAVVFERFFERVVGSKPWSAQRQWIRRLLLGESFVITAPTGTGKTTVLITYALYRALQGSRIYYLLPTSNLARQVATRLVSTASRLSMGVRIAHYHSLMPQRERLEALARMEAGDYDILVTTTAFLSKRWGLVEGVKFDAILVDDVDAVLRNSANIDRILMLLGASGDEVRAALRLVKLQMRLRANPALREKIREELERLKRVVDEASSRLGQLVVASATGRARGFKQLALSKLVGLSAGNLLGYARNIAEFRLVSSNPLDTVVEVVERLGPGGLVFVAKPLGVETARKLVKALEERGVKAGLAVAGRKVVERFEKGDYDVLVGVASYYGVIVRGLDLPYRVAYAVFLEPPYARVNLDKALVNPRRVLTLGKALGVEEVREYARILSKMTPDEVEILRAVLEGRLEPGERLAKVAELARRIAEAVIERVSSVTEPLDLGTSILVPGSTPYIAAPDPYTYIQASGRTSRLLKGYMTRGLVVVVSSWPLLLEKLEKRLKKLLPAFNLMDFDWDSVEEELRKAWESRRRTSGCKAAVRVKMETSLVLVESPTKARLISWFWGKPAKRVKKGVNIYETVVYNPHTGVTHLMMVVATKGHVYDLTEEPVGHHGVIVEGDEVKPVYTPIKRCRDCGEQFTTSDESCPRCGSTNIEDKGELIEVLRELARLVDRVYIGTDPDPEGEKIAWDLYTLLKPYARDVKRIEFHEVTRRAFLEALSKPRDVDRRLVEAQVVRRVEDRWIGFELSQHLWRRFGATWLGAGRVQTPTLGFLVERLMEWRRGRCYALYAKLPWGRLKLCFDNREDAMEALKQVISEGFSVEVLEKRVEVVPPPPPYTTETLLYDASRFLGFTAEKTMRLAQELFENGLITYHRTDSTHVSEVGLGIARSYLSKHGLETLYVGRRWGGEGTHEAIRPTNPLDVDELRDAIAEGEVRIVSRLREAHYRLYDLIFRRFVASQCKPAELEIARVKLCADNACIEELLVTRILDEGFLRFYRFGFRFAEGLASRVKPLHAWVSRSSRVRLYTHGELVMEMKRHGIGRPSTYAKIIDALKRHGYVIESRYRKLLVPTKLGVRVYKYLSTNFPELVSVERTRLLEKLMDSVARGEVDAAELLMELRREVVEAVERVEKLEVCAGAEGVESA